MRVHWYIVLVCVAVVEIGRDSDREPEMKLEIPASHLAGLRAYPRNTSDLLLL